MHEGTLHAQWAKTDLELLKYEKNKYIPGILLTESLLKQQRVWVAKLLPDLTQRGQNFRIRSSQFLGVQCSLFPSQIFHLFIQRRSQEVLKQHIVFWFSYDGYKKGHNFPRVWDLGNVWLQFSISETSISQAVPNSKPCLRVRTAFLNSSDVGGGILVWMFFWIMIAGGPPDVLLKMLKAIGTCLSVFEELVYYLHK